MTTSTMALERVRLSLILESLVRHRHTNLDFDEEDDQIPLEALDFPHQILVDSREPTDDEHFIKLDDHTILD